GGGNAYRDWLAKAPAKLKKWQIESVDRSGSTVTVTLSATLVSSGKSVKLEEEKWNLYQENGVWRIKPSAKFLEQFAAGDTE
ncbi:MAG: hypothetical protein GX881_06595, partial [Firmicutes bacterium]|nr:hypothetical protein [Bacillota bacterium]